MSARTVLILFVLLILSTIAHDLTGKPMDPARMAEFDRDMQWRTMEYDIPHEPCWVEHSFEYLKKGIQRVANIRKSSRPAVGKGGVL